MLQDGHKFYEFLWEALNLWGHDILVYALFSRGLDNLIKTRLKASQLSIIINFDGQWVNTSTQRQSRPEYRNVCKVKRRLESKYEYSFHWLNL